MQLQETEDGYFMDVEILVRYSGDKKMKLRDMDLTLAIAPEGEDIIPLGTVRKDEFIVPPRQGKTDTEVILPLHVELGEDIEALYLNIISSDQMNNLLMASDPFLDLYLSGTFDAGVLARIGWTYQMDMLIDWTIRTPIPRKVFIATFKAIEKAGATEEEWDDDAFYAEYEEREILLAEEDEPVTRNQDEPETVAVISASEEDDRPVAVKEIEAEDMAEFNIYLYFGKGQTDLTYQDERNLKLWIGSLPEVSEEWQLHIEGHTDLDGAPVNQEISEKRALNVLQYLYDPARPGEKFTISRDRITVKGFGEEKPVVAGHDAAANKINRRVEVYFRRKP